MALQVSHRRGGVVIVVHDPAETALLADVAGQMGDGPPMSMVVDLSSVAMVPTESIERLVSEMRAVAGTSNARHRWSVVAGTMTARSILRRLFADSHIGVYPDVDQALSATPPGWAATP